MAADSAARRLKLNTETGTTQSSVQNSRTPQKDLADGIRALLKQKCRSNSLRQVLKSEKQEILSSRQCNPAAEAQHKGRSNTEPSPDNRILQKFSGKNHFNFSRKTHSQKTSRFKRYFLKTKQTQHIQPEQKREQGLSLAILS